jgi:hypothetical protein
VSGKLNDTEVTCVLVSHQINAKPTGGPRRWALMPNWQSLGNDQPGAPHQPHEIFFTTLFLH